MESRFVLRRNAVNSSIAKIPKVFFDPMVETRIAPRLRVSKAAAIEFIGGTPINCVVRNLSVTGAAIELSDPGGIPNSFLLVMPDDGLRLPCRIVRRAGYLLGVAFE